MVVGRRGLCWVVLWLLLFSAADLPVRAQSVVERVSFTPRSDGHGYVVRVHTSGLVNGYWVPRKEDGRVTWRLIGAQPAGELQRDPPSGPVADYRIQADGQHTVLQLDLTESVELNAYRDRASTDLLLSLETPSGTPVVQASSSAGASHAVSGDRWRLDTIVIDAGHGGKDAGATAYGIREKDVVLNVALKLGAYLEEHLDGVNVVFTRDDDRFIELAERGRIANAAGGKLFVSIHANAARNRSAYGSETYFLGMHRSASAERVMERENSVVRLESDPSHYEALDEQQLILRTLAQSAYMRKSEELAGLVQHQFHERVGRRDRGVKQAGFYVLWSASMPAILVELGFLTNRSEASFLRSDEGQTYLASAIFRAIRDFREAYERDINVAEGD